MVTQAGHDQTAVKVFVNCVESPQARIPHFNPVQHTLLPIKPNDSLCLARHEVTYFIASHAIFYALRRFNLA